MLDWCRDVHKIESQSSQIFIAWNCKYIKNSIIIDIIIIMFITISMFSLLCLFVCMCLFISVCARAYFVIGFWAVE
jgi:hypothetical protein